jgi:hypothetical protein
MLKTIVTRLVTAFLVACASGGTTARYQYDPKQSETLNVMEAAHIGGMQDLPYQKFQEAREAALKKGMSLDNGPTLGGGAAFGALNYLSPPTGFSAGGAGVMGLASWLLIDTTHPGITSHIFAWMPAEEAASPEEAKMKLYDIFKDALADAIKETSWPKDYSVHLTDSSKTTPKDGFIGEFAVVITGGDCDREFMRCGYRGFRTPLPRTEMAPDFLGGSNAYVWRWPVENQHWAIVPDKSKIKVTERGSTAEWYAGFPDLEFYTALTRRLPKWVYVYLAPQNWSHNINGKYVFSKYPVVINQGHVLHFIEPAPTTAAR